MKALSADNSRAADKLPIPSARRAAKCPRNAPESTRAWMEQAESFATGVPTVAVISAGAEPMVRPYAEDPNAAPNANLSSQLPLKGLVVGLGGAAAYERHAYSPGAATMLWPALGGGLLGAALLIALGNLFFALWGALRRRRS